ncbi:MAG: class I SAM-dependent methyltransferase [Nitrospirota bacterium]
MESKKFDPKKLAKLNDPQRLEYMNPDVIWNVLKLADPKVVVDIGAGTGFFSVLFADRMKKGKVYACDISDIMIEWMKENLPPAYDGRVIPLKMGESAVPLRDGIADMVLMINLHHELEEPAKIIAEAYRLLGGGGKLMIIDWKKEETPHGPPVSIRVEEETILSQMKQGGFSNITSHKILPYHNVVVGEKL